MSALVTRLVRFVHWHRRAVAVALTVLAVLCLAAGAQQRGGPTAQVLVATRTIEPGAVVGADDVALRALPRTSVPHDALTAADDAVGKVATAGSSAGSVLTRFSVVAPKLTHGSGLVLAPLRLSDADIAGYLNPGDSIDVVSATEASATTVAHGARVIALPQSKTSTFGASDSRGVLVIVAVAPAEATALAQAGSGGRLTVALR